jgi:hypothetical protein
VHVASAIEENAHPASRLSVRDQQVLRLSAGVAGAAREIPTALLPALLSMISPVAVPEVLGLIEGGNDLLSGFSLLGGAALARQSRRRRRLVLLAPALAGIAAGLLGVATAAWQAAMLRWTGSVLHELHTPAHRSMLEPAPRRARGSRRWRAVWPVLGGPLAGAVAAAALYALIGLQGALVASLVLGIVASALMLRAFNRIPAAAAATPVRRATRRRMRNPLGRLLLSVVAFEFGNVAATLLILRVIALFKPKAGVVGAVEIGVALYAVYLLAHRLMELPARRVHVARGPVPALATGVTLFLLSYLGFAFTDANLAVVTACFVGAGLATSAVHTTEVALLEAGDDEIAHSTQGFLIAIRAVANFTASVVTGILWSIVSVRAALLYLGGWLLISLVGLVVAARGHRLRAARAA